MTIRVGQELIRGALRLILAGGQAVPPFRVRTRRGSASRRASVVVDQAAALGAELTKAIRDSYRLEDAMAQLGVHVDETFRAFAKRWWKSKQLRIDESTVSDYQWRLGYRQRFFGRYQLREITTAVVDRFRDELHDQAETIRAAQARAGEKKNGLMETVTDKRARTYQRRRRPLSNTSINAMIKLRGQILQQAVDYEPIDRNPVRAG